MMLKTTKKKNYTDDFKYEIVQLYKSGQKVINISENYQVSPKNIYKWIEQFNKTGSFKTKDQLTSEQKEIIALKKENKKLKEHIEILKQAALIIAKEDI